MQYLNEDRKSIGNVYAEMYKPKTNSSVIKENEEFYDIEDHADQLDGDLDLPPFLRYFFQSDYTNIGKVISMPDLQTGKCKIQMQTSTFCKV